MASTNEEFGLSDELIKNFHESGQIDQFFGLFQQLLNKSQNKAISLSEIWRNETFFKALLLFIMLLFRRVTFRNDSISIVDSGFSSEQYVDVFKSIISNDAGNLTAKQKIIYYKCQKLINEQFPNLLDFSKRETKNLCDSNSDAYLSDEIKLIISKLQDRISVLEVENGRNDGMKSEKINDNDKSQESNESVIKDKSQENDVSKDESEYKGSFSVSPDISTIEVEERDFDGLTPEIYPKSDLFSVVHDGKPLQTNVDDPACSKIVDDTEEKCKKFSTIVDSSDERKSDERIQMAFGVQESARDEGKDVNEESARTAPDNSEDAQNEEGREIKETLGDDVFKYVEQIEKGYNELTVDKCKIIISRHFENCGSSSNDFESLREFFETLKSVIVKENGDYSNNIPWSLIANISISHVLTMDIPFTYILYAIELVFSKESDIHSAFREEGKACYYSFFGSLGECLNICKKRSYDCRYVLIYYADLFVSTSWELQHVFGCPPLDEQCFVKIFNETMSIIGLELEESIASYIPLCFKTIHETGMLSGERMFSFQNYVRVYKDRLSTLLAFSYAANIEQNVPEIHSIISSGNVFLEQFVSNSDVFFGIRAYDDYSSLEKIVRYIESAPLRADFFEDKSGLSLFFSLQRFFNKIEFLFSPLQFEKCVFCCLKHKPRRLLMLARNGNRVRESTRLSLISAFSYCSSSNIDFKYFLLYAAERVAKCYWESKELGCLELKTFNSMLSCIRFFIENHGLDIELFEQCLTFFMKPLQRNLFCLERKTFPDFSQYYLELEKPGKANDLRKEFVDNPTVVPSLTYKSLTEQTDPNIRTPLSFDLSVIRSSFSIDAFTSFIESEYKEIVALPDFCDFEDVLIQKFVDRTIDRSFDYLNFFGVAIERLPESNLKKSFYLSFQREVFDDAHDETYSCIECAFRWRIKGDDVIQYLVAKCQQPVFDVENRVNCVDPFSEAKLEGVKFAVERIFPEGLKDFERNLKIVNSGGFDYIKKVFPNKFPKIKQWCERHVKWERLKPINTQVEASFPEIGCEIDKALMFSSTESKDKLSAANENEKVHEK